MDVLIARLSHETNTFAPVTAQEAFFADIGGTGAEAFVEQCRARSLQHHVSFVATANPSGPVDHNVFERYAALLLADVVRLQPRVCLLDLHGAMVTTQLDDAEGELLRRVREAAPTAVVAVCLDLHGNVTPAMVEHADLLACFQTYPHVDMRETGERVARFALDVLAAQKKQVHKAFLSVPLLASTLCSRTDIDGPMLRAVNAAKKLEESGKLLSASVFAGFPLSDMVDAGVSLVAYGNDANSVNAAILELRQQIWNERDAFVFRPAPVEKSMADMEAQLAIKKEEGKYVLLLDHADNVMSGGSASSVRALQLLLLMNIRFLCGPICHPVLAARLTVGAVGFFDLGEGVTVMGKIIAVSSGEFVVTGPIYNGSTVHMGRTVALERENGSVVVLSEKPVEPFDEGVFGCLSISYKNFDLLVLKSRMYCRPVFSRNATTVIPIDCGGLTSSHYSYFVFCKLRRPIFPLDGQLTAAAALRQTTVAVQKQKLGPIVTKTCTVACGSFRFAVRVVTSLELKKKALQQQGQNGDDPFAVPDPDLVMDCVVLPQHVVLLNKFPVLQQHILLTTREYKSQNETLMLEDFEALSLCCDGVGWLAFYNCGPLSGRSQPHKHLQIVPYPFDDSVSTLDDAALAFPFVHAAATISSWSSARDNFDTYLRLLREVGQVPCESHNVLLSATTMLVVPRSAEDYNGISLNSLAFAFSLFAPTDEACRRIEEEGPLNILQRISFPKLATL